MQHIENQHSLPALIDEQDFELKLFPNPATVCFELRTTHAVTHLEIRNSEEQLVAEMEDPGNRIPINHLATGFYTVTITNDDGISATRRLEVL